MKLYIKNMVCIRCKLVVKSELDKMGFHYSNVDLGEVEIMEEISPDERKRLGTGLRMLGLELWRIKKACL